MEGDLSTSDFTDLDAALSDVADLPAGADGADRHPDDSAWRVREKEPAEPKSLGDELETAFDAAEAAKGAQDGDAAWLKEQRKLADAALESAGFDPAKRHEVGLSRREIVRRLFAAEAAMRSDPAAAFGTLAAGYAGTLEPADRARVAAGVLSRLGFPTPQSIGETERQELQSYRQHAQAQRAAEEAMRPQVAAQVADFRAAHPDFDALRPTMHALIAAGRASDLATAYQLAARAEGLATVQESAIQAADAARRSKVAKAQAAGTPSTKSASGSRYEVASDKSIDQLLNDGFDQLGIG